MLSFNLIIKKMYIKGSVMKKALIATALVSSLLLGQSDYKYEITPMIGGNYTEGTMDMDRNFVNGGLSFGYNFDDSMFDQVELGVLTSLESVDYDQINKDTRVTRFFTNLVKEYPLGEHLALYALAGIGYEHFSDAQLGNENGLFANYGVGTKYTLSNDMALKFDLRHLIEDDHGDNNLLYTVGLAIPFGKKAVAMPMEKEPEPEPMVDGDDDMDGVANSIDKCPDTPPKSIVDTDGCVITVNLQINFDTDKATIKEQYNSKLEGFSKILKGYPSVKTTLHAHTDNVGTESYNMALSQRRADSVKKALVGLGIEPERITTIGYGESKPLTTNDTVEGKAQNRRVEATVNQ